MKRVVGLLTVAAANLLTVVLLHNLQPAEAQVVRQLGACRTHVTSTSAHAGLSPAAVDVVPGRVQADGTATVYWHIAQEDTGHCVVNAAGEVLRYQEQGISIQPMPGVSCHQPAQICFDGSGPSVAFTEEYFGREAADQLIRALDRRR
ncbi:MAG: YcgJ family protein [Synechococcales bacterium]|nr:YcgJ family protein [Synechococcales bacterium]